MTAANVKRACNSVNLETPCFSASYSLSNGCVQWFAMVRNGSQWFAISSGDTFLGLSQVMCQNNNPKNCSELHGVFIFMRNWVGGASCGVKPNAYCATGSYYSNEFSLCVEKGKQIQTSLLFIVQKAIN